MYLYGAKHRIFPRQGGTGHMAIDRAELVAIFLEAMLYGFEALTFVATVYLLHGAKRNKYSFFKFGFVITIFLLNTIHAGVSLRRILNAFGGLGPGSTPFVIGYLSDVAGFLYRFKKILVVIQTIMLDILVVYRCYMVWDKTIWITFVPLPGIFAYIVAGVAAVHAFAVDTNDTIFTGPTKTWVAATICITLLTKLVCLTIVVVGTVIPREKSLWYTSYLKVERYPGLYKTALILIESGGLAILAELVLVPVYLSNQNAQSVLWGALSPMTGQSFLLIMAASLLGLTPSMSGASSRRRRSNVPNTKITIPPIPVSPVVQTIPGRIVSSVPPITPWDTKKSALPSSETQMGYPHSRSSRGYSQDSIPFNTVFATHEDNSEGMVHRDPLPYDNGCKNIDM